MAKDGYRPKVLNIPNLLGSNLAWFSFHREDSRRFSILSEVCVMASPMLSRSDLVSFLVSFSTFVLLCIRFRYLPEVCVMCLTDVVPERFGDIPGKFLHVLVTL